MLKPSKQSLDSFVRQQHFKQRLIIRRLTKIARFIAVFYIYAFYIQVSRFHSGQHYYRAGLGINGCFECCSVYYFD